MVYKPTAQGMFVISLLKNIIMRYFC